MNATIDIVLDGSGNGVARFPSVPTGHKYYDYTRVALQLDTGDASKGGQAYIYSGADIPSNYIDASAVPWSDTATFAVGQCRVDAPEQLHVVFASCDPGAAAHITATYNKGR